MKKIPKRTAKNLIETTNIRVWKTSYKRLKEKAFKEGVSLVEMLDTFSKG